MITGVPASSMVRRSHQGYTLTRVPARSTTSPAGTSAPVISLSTIATDVGRQSLAPACAWW